MPMTWADEFTSEPPESPGWMSALVSMRPVRFSELPPLSSLAVIDWLRATTDPPALLGVPPVPPALPTPTTASPTEACESVVTVWRPLAPVSCTTATSPVRSYPTTLPV